MKDKLAALQQFFATGGTRSYDFRRAQLLALKEAVLKHEQELYTALHTDLKKSPEETWVTEIGFLLAEISHTLKHLKRWMKPQKVSTNLLNLPGRSSVLYEPMGVVLIIAPWNYPMQLLLAPLVGAIAAGNAAVLKPSEWAPATAEVLQKIITETFPENYLLMVQGDGAIVVPQLLADFRFAHIFYTGSTQVGRIIYTMAAQQLIPVTLELGGKSPCVVERDADLRVAARRIAMTKFSNAGQMCVAPDYVLVERSVKEELTGELRKAIGQFFSADPSTDYQYGKIIHERQHQRLISYLNQGHIVHGGRHDAAQLYIEPTLMDEVSLDSPLMNDEIFGPILPLIPFDSAEEARAIIARHPDPLAFYIFTQDKQKQNDWLEKIPFGGGCVNNASWHLTNFNLPFGGRGNSGTGAYHGRYSFETFSHKKAVMRTPTWFDPALKYPPFKGKLGLFRKFIR